MDEWPLAWHDPRVVLMVLAIVTAIALLVAATTSSTAFGTYNPAWDGASDLREMARESGAEAIVAREVEAYDTVTPNETVAVVLAPRENYSTAEAARLRAFLARGGTLIVAEDFGTTGNNLLAALNATSRINGSVLRDDRFFFRSPALPEATNVSAHPLTAGVDSITINHGSAVEPNGAIVIVRTSSFAYADLNANDELDEAEQLASYPVITVESVGDGTVITAGDPSLFINVMLERPGNAAFVRTVFESHGTVLLDYSHAGSLPPLALAILVIRQSDALQLVLGLSGLIGIVLWTRDNLEVPVHLTSRTDPAIDTPFLSEDELIAFIDRRHPEWDDERVRRVVRGLKNARLQPDSDE